MLRANASQYPITKRCSCLDVTALLVPGVPIWWFLSDPARSKIEFFDRLNTAKEEDRDFPFNVDFHITALKKYSHLKRMAFALQDTQGILATITKK